MPTLMSAGGRARDAEEGVAKLEAQWELLLKKQGFEDSFQNAILERVQTPRGSFRPSPASVPSLAPQPSPAPSNRALFADVEEVSARLQVGLDEQDSARSMGEPSLHGPTAGAPAPQQPGAQVLMLSDFATSQGVQFKNGDPVVLVRHGQRGWSLVCDSEGRKSWVPVSYLLGGARKGKGAEREGQSPALGDGRYELLQLEPAQPSGGKQWRDPSLITPPQPQVPEPRSVPHTESSTPHLGEPPKFKSMEIDARVNEKFSEWAADDGDAARTREQEQLGRLPLGPIGHPSQPDLNVNLPPGMGFVYPSDIRRIEDTVTALEQSMMRLASQQQRRGNHLATRIDHLQGLADVNLLAELEQALFKEREQQEKDSYAWSLEKRQLERAVQQLSSDLSALAQNAKRQAEQEQEEEWRGERRKLMQELQSERERASWMEDRLFAQAPLDGAGDQENQMQAIKQQLLAAHKDKTALAQKLHEVQELLAERDVGKPFCVWVG
jgi:hypothetical protein